MIFDYKDIKSNNVIEQKKFLLNNIENRKNILMSFIPIGIKTTLIYKNGILDSTQINGNNWTKKSIVTFVNKVPNRLPININLTIDGYITFFKTNKNKKLSNKTNIENNILNYINIGDKSSKLRFVGCNVNSDFLSSSIYDSSKYVVDFLNMYFVHITKYTFKKLIYWEMHQRYSDFLNQGILIFDDNSLNPNPLLWRFNNNTEVVKLDKIKWDLEVNELVPKGYFKPIKILSKRYFKINLSSYGFLRENKIDEGTLIRIGPNGNFIETIHSTCELNPNFPKYHKDSGEKTFFEGDLNGSNLHLKIENTKRHTAESIFNFFHILNCNVRSDILNSLLNQGLIKSPQDCYYISVDQIENLGFTFRQAIVFIATIRGFKQCNDLCNSKLIKVIKKELTNSKFDVEFRDFVLALGIPGVTLNIATSLAEYFKDIDLFLKAKSKDITNIDRINIKLAYNIKTFFKEFSVDIEELRQYMNIIHTPNKPKNIKTFCLFGKFKDKELIENKIKAKEHILTDDVNNCNYIIISGHSCGPKFKLLRPSSVILHLKYLDNLLDNIV